MNSPFFSVVIPSYNRAKIISSSITSVLNQTFSNFELIIIDDGSRDNTKAVVDSYNDQRAHYFYKDNGGESSARNLGIEKSKGQYICFLDSDDIYFENHLQVLYDKIKVENFPIAFFRTGMYLEQNNKLLQTGIYTSREEKKYKHPVHYFALHFCGINSICIHRDCFENNHFDIRFYLFPDTHLILRILAQYSFFQVPFYTCKCCEHKGRISISTYKKKDVEKSIENNISAINSIFYDYGDLVKPLVPNYLQAKMLSMKYINYANGLLLNSRYKLSLKYIRLAYFHYIDLQHFLFYTKFYIKLIIFKFLGR